MHIYCMLFSDEAANIQYGVWQAFSDRTRSREVRRFSFV